MKRDLPKKISSDRLLKINRRTVFLRKINRRTVFLRKINRRTVFLRKISETAKKVGASPDTLRRWEKEGKITPIRTKGGTRLYPDFVKIGKAAKATGVSIDTLRRWERSGKITTIRTPGGTRLYSLDNLQKINPFSKVKTPPTETISDHIETNKPPSVPKTTSDLLENIEEIESPLKDFQKTPYLTTVTDLSPPQPIPPTYIKKIYARIYARIYASRMIFQKNGFVFFLFTLIIIASLLIGVRKFGSNLSYQKTVTPPADVLAITSSSKFLEVNSDTQINGSLSTTGRINELLLEATPSAGTLALSSGDTRLSVTNDALIDQDVSTTASPTFNALNLSSTNNQLIFQSGGPTGTLTWTPTTNQVINLPDLASTLSTTLVGTNTTQTLTNKTISGASNTLSNIPNSALSNSKVTVTAGTNLSGGGDVSLGSSITINLKDAVSLASTLAVTGATTLSSTVTVSGISSGSGSTVCVNSSNQLVSCATGSAIAGSGTTNYISKFSSASAIGNSSIFDNGNVGIGTSAPSQTFQVNTNTSNPIVMTSGGNVGIGFTSPNSALSVGSANQFAINSSGNLTRINNIPYSFPSSQAAAVNYVLANDSSGNLSWAAVAGVGGVTGTGNSGGVTYWTGTSTVSDSIANFYWDSTNNRLGIGTSSPQYRLDVSGTGYFSGFVGIGSSLNVTGNVGIGQSLTVTSAALLQGGLAVTGGSVVLPAGSIQNSELENSSITVTATAGTGLSVSGSPVSLGGTLTIAGVDATTSTKGVASFNSTNFTVSSGAVNTIQDIATTSSPTFNNLTLSGNLGVGGSLVVTGNVGIGKSLTVTDLGIFNKGINVSGLANLTGNVGVGSSLNVSSVIVGSNGLVITGTGAFTGRVSGADANSSNEFVTLSQLQGGSGSLWQDGGDYLNPNSTFATNVRIPAGNLGIGTSATSGSTLQINGNGVIGWGTAAVAGPASGLAVFGNVGVGTTSPLGALHVVGQCVAKGTRIRRRRRNSKGEWEEEDIPVEDIKPDDEILSLDDKTGEWEWHKVEKTWDKGKQTVYRLETETGKWIETTANHPYLMLEEELFNKEQIDQENQQPGNQHQTKSYSSFNVDIFNVNFPVNNFSNHNYISFLNINAAAKQIIPNPILTVNNQGLSFGLLTPHGIKIDATNQPADRLINKSDNVITNVLSTLKSISQAKWTKVSELSVGQYIATADSWEKVVSIHGIGRKQTYDLQIEETHNFVGNDIVAHNTYITGNVGIGFSSPNNQLTVGSSSQFQVDSSGNIRMVNSVPYSFPSAQGASNTVLTNDSAGNLTWSTVAGVGGVTGTGNSGGVTYWTGTSTVDDSVANFYWDSTNNRLGIGTSAPSQTFQVNTNTASPFVVTSGGNLGIGFTTPDRMFQLSSDINIVGSNASLLGTAGTQFAITGSTANNLLKKLVLGIDTTDNYGVIQAGAVGTNYNLALNPAGGNIGIGQTSPADRLHISGFLRTDDVAWASNNNFGSDLNVVLSMAVFNGKLYAGMGSGWGDADVYVYDGSTWTLSNDPGAGARQTKSLAVYNGKLYAGTWASANDYGDVYVYNGSTWSLSNDFGTAIEEVNTMAVYNGKLYTGVGNGGGDVEVHVYDGSTWSLSNDFGANLNSVYALAVYNGKLYAGVGGGTAGAGVYVYDGSTWSLSNDFGADTDSISSLAVYNGKLYAGTSIGDAEVHVYDGSTWSTSTSLGASYGAATDLAVYNGKLYAGTSTDGDVFVYDGSSWSLSYNQGGSEVGALAVYNGKLYAGGVNTTPQAYVYSERLESQLAKEFNPAVVTPFNEQYQHFLKDITMSGNLGVGGSLVVTGNVGVGRSLTVTDLGVFNKGINVSGLANLTGNVGIGSSLTTTGLGVFNGGLNVSGLSNLTGNVGIGGSLTVTSAPVFSALGLGVVQSNASGALSSGPINLASSSFVSGILPVVNGGTGTGTFTSNGVLYGNGTSAIQVTAAGGTNSVLTANGGAPSFSSTPTLSSLTLAGNNNALSFTGSTPSISSSTSFSVFPQGGNVGIGTSEPLYGALTVKGVGTGTGIALQTYSGSSLTQGLTVLDNGNVGIGTTTPSAMLHLASTSAPGIRLNQLGTSGDYTIGFTGSDANISSNLSINNSSGFLIAGTIYRTGGSGETISITSQTGGAAVMTSAGTGSKTLIIRAIASQTGNLLEWQNSSSVGLGIINVNGNVGIGTTTANSNLSVAGSAHIGGLFQGIAAPANGLFVDGNVGIGATTSNNKLDVWGGARITNGLTLEGLSSSAATALCINSSNQVVTCSGSSALTGTGVSGGVTYWTGTSTVTDSVANFYWDNTNRRLGIGTSSPQYSLDVAGTGYFSGFVGIGSSLNVSGNVGVGSSLTVTSAAALSTLNTTGLANLASLNVNGTTSITDTSNTLASLSLSNNTATTIGNGGNTLGVIDLGSTSLTTGNFMNIELNGLSTGKGINLTSTSTALTTGNLMSIDWSPGSATTATSGDLFKITIGTNGTLSSGNLFNIVDTTSSIFSVSESSFITSLPASFNAAGDVSIAYDLNFTNPTASYIKSNAPLYITAGKVFNSSDLTLTTYNQGQIFLNSAAGVYAIGNVGIGVSYNAATLPSNGMAIQGNVGIGASTANSTLSVAGSAHIGSTRQGIAAPTDGLFVDGNVGIGATTSNNKLDVWGNSRLAGTLTVDSTSTFGSSLTLSSGQFLAPIGAGTAGNVSYSFTGDTDTGMFSSGANNLSFAVNGEERFRVTSNADIAIAAGAKIFLDGVGGNGDTYIQESPGNTMNFYAGGTRAMSITSGNVGIGFTSPERLLQLASDINIVGSNASLLGAAGTQFAITGSSGTGGTEKKLVLGIDTTDNYGVIQAGAVGTNYNLSLNPAGGNVGIGTTSPTSTLQVLSGSTAFTISSTGNVGIGSSLSVTSGANLSSSLNVTGNTNLTTANATGLAITNTSNTVAALSLTNNTATTIGNGGNTLGVIDLQSTSLTTGNFLNIELNGLSSGKGLNLTSTSTAFSSGTLLNLDWSPTTATTATGNLLNIGIGVSGTAGNLLNIQDTGSSIFSISESSFITSLPASFNAPGDVAIAYDINFTNPTASYIKSAAPLYITSGEVFNSSDLTLTTYNQGQIFLNSAAGVYAIGNVGIGVSMNAVTMPTNGMAIQGNVGIGASTANSTLSVAGSAHIGSTRQGVAAPTDGLLVDGNVGIGVTTASQRLEVGGRIRMGTWTADGTTAIYYNAANGDIGLQSSDIRLKTNIIPIQNSLDIIKGINGVTFNWLADGVGAQKTVGVIAQDVTKVMPELVYPITGPDGNSYFGVHYDKLGPVLIEGIKEQQTQINTLLAQQSADSTLLSGLAISSDGNLSVPKLSADYLTLSSDVNFAATDLATLLTTTGGAGGYNVDVLASLNAISTAVLGIQAQESSTSAKLANLESRVDTQESALADLQTQVASASATLSAAIASLSAQLAQNTATSSSVIASDSAAISTSSNEIATSSSTPRDDVTTLNLTPPSILLATGSATLTTGASAQLVNLEVTSDATISGMLTAYQAEIQDNFKVFGQTTLGTTLVAGDLTVDGTLTLTGNSLSTLSTLYIQDSSLAGPVDFFNGLVTIDKAGKLTAQVVEAPELVTQKLTISNQPLGPSPPQDPSIGSDKIAAGTTKAAVLSNRILQSSKIFITPRSSTGKETPFVELVEPRVGFVVSIDQAISRDIDFDWWIVETR